MSEDRRDVTPTDLGNTFRDVRRDVLAHYDALDAAVSAAAEPSAGKRALMRRAAALQARIKTTQIGIVALHLKEPPPALLLFLMRLQDDLTEVLAQIVIDPEPEA